MSCRIHIHQLTTVTAKGFQFDFAVRRLHAARRAFAGLQVHRQRAGLVGIRQRHFDGAIALVHQQQLAAGWRDERLRVHVG